MKNLKLILVLITLLISSTGIFAQNFYISANVGYGFGINGMTGVLTNSERVEYLNQQSGESSITNTNENIYLSFGKGTNFGINFGYMFNENVGVDLGMSYLLGGNTEGLINTKRTIIDPSGVYNESSIVDKSTASSKMFRINPTLVLSPKLEKFNPYVRIGGVLGIGNSTIESNRVTNVTSGTYTDIRTNEWKEGVAIGFSAAVGVELPVAENLVVFGEANYIGMSYAASKQELIKYDVNGVDQLPNVSVSAKETILKDTYTWGLNQSTNPDEPSVSNKVNMPFSSLGLNFGVKFNFQ